MEKFSNKITKSLLQSLIEAPPLLGDLPEASIFPHHTLTLPKELTNLNFQQKLGHLYEDSLATLLASSTHYEIVEKSHQIREDTGRTLGELDFLIRELASNQLLHLELAVKFYLAVETPDGLLLPGPDARDNYFRKLEKMRSHQLVLTQKFQHLLPEKFQHEKITTQQIVHGCIFDHIHATQLAEADFLNQNGRRGKWLHSAQCTDFFGHKTNLEIIPKPLWPVPLESITDIPLEKWLPNTTIDRCVMVRAKHDNTPYFIAPDDYPELNN